LFSVCLVSGVAQRAGSQHLLLCGDLAKYCSTSRPSNQQMPKESLLKTISRQNALAHQCYVVMPSPGKSYPRTSHRSRERNVRLQRCRFYRFRLVCEELLFETAARLPPKGGSQC